MSLRIIKDSTPLNPYMNLAVEEALNNVEVNTPIVRLWINKPSVILGRFDEVLREVNIGYCIANDIYVARRHSGGGAVYHDEGNLNITLVFPRKYGLDLCECYESLGEVIIEVINELGLDAEFQRPNEILINGFKVSGMAGSLTKHSLQCHSTLLISSDLTKLTSSLRRLKRDVTTLSNELKAHVNAEFVSDKIVEAVIRKFNPSSVDEGLKDDELELARELYGIRYSLISWHFSR